MYTIIIANYNRISELNRCLDSIEIAFDGFEEPEIIVVEDASEKTLTDSRIKKHILLSKNGGPVRARLEGVKSASFEYILLLDSDDTLLRSAVETIQKITTNNPNYDLYGFTYKGGESLIDFEIKSIQDYCDFVSYEGRTSDYIMLIKSDVLSQYVSSHSFRISEIWLFSEIFVKYFGFYSRESIFNYHQDAQEQLSKKKVFRFSLDNYEHQSVSRSVKFFVSFMSVCKCKVLRNAWRRRLIKESVLHFNFKALIKVLCLKK